MPDQRGDEPALALKAGQQRQIDVHRFTRFPPSLESEASDCSILPPSCERLAPARAAEDFDEDNGADDARTGGREEQ
jgi:hypothetical protein